MCTGDGCICNDMVARVAGVVWRLRIIIQCSGVACCCISAPASAVGSGVRAFGIAMGKFTGVTCPLYRGRRCGWLAQNRSCRLWRIGFGTQGEAAAWLAKQLKVPLASLKKTSKVKATKLDRKRRAVIAPVSTYVGVVFHRRLSNNCHHRWEARVGGQVVGTFTAESEAVARVAEELDVDTEELKKSVGTLSSRVAKRVFSEAFPIFKKYRPGDLTSAQDMEKKYAKLFRQDLSAKDRHADMHTDTLTR
jgi:hypothetical protein